MTCFKIKAHIQISYLISESLHEETKDCRQLEFAEYFLLADYISGLNILQSYVPMYSVYSCVLFICHEKNGKIKIYLSRNSNSKPFPHMEDFRCSQNCTAFHHSEVLPVVLLSKLWIFSKNGRHAA